MTKQEFIKECNRRMRDKKARDRQERFRTWLRKYGGKAVRDAQPKQQ